MCCEHLVCARCAHAVADGHCPVCRAARARYHGEPGLPLTYLYLLLAAVAMLAAVLGAHLAR